MSNDELKTINAVIKNKDIATLLTDEGVDDLFTAYGDVWSEIKSYYTKFRTVPTINVLQDKFGDDIEVVDIDAPTEYYLNHLKERFLRLKMKVIMTRSAEIIDNESPGRVLDKMAAELAKLNKYTNVVKDIDLNDVDAAIEHFKAVQERAATLGRDIGVRTNFKSIDTAIPNGLAPGNLIYILGYPGHGKSFWTQLLAGQAYQQGISPMIINLEMSANDVRDRAYTMLDPGAFDLSELQKADVNFDDFRSFAKRKLVGPKFMIVGAGGMTSSLTPNQIQGKIDQYKPGIVFVDYVQLMSDNGQSKDMTPKMMNLSKELKFLAQVNNIPVVAVTSIKRDQNVNRDEMPGIENIYGGSQLEFDADHVWGVHRVPDTNLIEIAGLKNRFGPLWNFYADVDLSKGIWKENFEL